MTHGTMERIPGIERVDSDLRRYVVAGWIGLALTLTGLGALIHTVFIALTGVSLDSSYWLIVTPTGILTATGFAFVVFPAIGVALGFKVVGRVNHAIHS